MFNICEVDNLIRLIIVIVLIFLVLLIIDFFRYFYYKKRFKESIGYCGYMLGYNLFISGKIRSGKSSLMAALSHILTIVIRNKADNDINESQTILNDIDFNVLDQEIFDLFKDSYHEDEIYDELYDKYALLIQGKLDDGLKEKNNDKLFKQYIEAVCSYYENNYVASNIKIKSRLTGNISKPFSMNDLEIKELYEKGEKYMIKPYKIFCYDESATKNTAHAHQRVASEDKGISTTLRLIGQLGKERTYLLYVQQNAKRKVKEEREVFNNCLNVAKLNIHEYYSFRWILNVLRAVFTFIYNVFAFITHPRYKKRMIYKHKPNIFKRIDKLFYIAQKRAFSKGWLTWIVRLYLDVDDEGKENTENNTYYYPMLVTTPIKFSFGTYDTHFYNFINEIMNKKCIVRFSDIKDGLDSVYSDYKDLPDEIIEELDSIAKDILEKNKKENDKQKDKDDVNDVILSDQVIDIKDINNVSL